MKSEWNFDDTIRGTIKGAPVSLDMSEEFEMPVDWANVQVDVVPSEMGTVRPRRLEPEPESVREVPPADEPEIPAAALSERGVAGRALVKDVLLPALAKVSHAKTRLTAA